MRVLFILLLYNISLAFSQLLTVCNSTCNAHSTSLLPVFSNSTTSDDLNLLKIQLLSQVDTCFNGEFTVEIYLAGSKDWLKCCDARSCSRAVFNLTREDFICRELKGSIDSEDACKIWTLTKERVDQNDSTVYVLTNFLTPKLWNAKLNVKYNLITNELKNLSLQVTKDNNVKIISSISELFTSTPPFCSRSIPNRTCPFYPQDPANATVEFRIFLGFSSKGHFDEIIEGLGKFLSEVFFDEQQGRIIILGPRARVLGRCWWYNAHKCIVDLQGKGEELIYVDTENVSRDDLEFSPDVMGFMRREAIQKKQLQPTFVLVLSDFISLNFLDNKYIFQKALATQPVALILGIMLSWNGIDRQTAKKYYGNLVNSNVLYPMELFADLNGLADRILNISFEIPSTNEALTSTIFPITLNSPEDSKHASDVVIVLSLAYWTSELQLILLKEYLNKAATCVNEENQYAIQKNEQDDDLMFCADPFCFLNEVKNLDLWNAISDVNIDNTYELVKKAVDVLDPVHVAASKIPSIFLVTNYISTTFMKKYDDSRSEFRRTLSFVDFQIILINSSTTYHEYTSLNNKMIHFYPSFDDLTKADNYLCDQNRDESQLKQGLGLTGIVLICITSTVFFIAMLIIAYIVYKIRKRNRKTSMDKVPIISRECDDLGKEILNISGLACIREDPWEMSRQQIIQGIELGRGSGGVVFRGSILGKAPCEYIYRRSFYAYQYDNCPVAIKEQLIGSDEKGRQQLLDEIEIMKAIPPHQNIANMLGCVTTVIPVCLVIEYAEGGSLKQFIKCKPILPAGTQPCGEHRNAVCQRDVLSYLWQICNGLGFIHQCGVIHRDIAARNILLKRGRDVLIADFGLAIWKSSIPSYTKIKRLPIKWSAPEALSKAQFSEASDVWSFGICAWEILMSGEDPFNFVATPEILSYLNSGRRPDRPPTCDDQLWKLLRSCWYDDPNKRPRFFELKDKLTPLLEDICSGYGYVIPQLE